MSKRKRKKSFAQKYSSDFEKLSLDIVKSFINEENIKAAETTREKKDGGFDGIIIYKDMSSEDRVHLIEAKLRTEKKDLPLSDFSKTIIIAVNSDASCVYISTNLYFSEKTIAELESFIRSTGMDIQTIDGNEISKWINEANSSIIKKYPVDFINTLKTYEYSDKTAPCKKLTISGKHTLTVQKIEYLQLYGAERKNMEKSLLNVLKSNPATIVVSGYNGTGKHTFINNILNDLVSSKKKFLIANIEADKITSKKDFAYRLLSRFWGCSYKSTISFLENKDENSKLIEKFCSKEIANSLNSVFDSNEKDIDLDILFSYLYDLYKSKRENKYIFYLSGVSEICDKEIQSFVLTFIRKFTNVISILLTINDDAVNDDAIQNEQNYFFKSSLLESKNILKESLPDWTDMDAYSYIADRAKQDKEIINNYQEIIEYFGKNPMCLSAAMDFITEDRHILEQISSNSLGMLDSTYYFRKIKSLLEKYVRRSTKAYRHLLYLITFFDGNLKIEFLKHMDIVDSDSINNFVDLYPFIKKNTTEIFFCRKIYTVLMSDLMKSYINSQEYREFDEKIISNIEWQSSDKLYNDEKIFEIYINGKNIAAIELYISLLATYKKDNLYLKIYKLSKLALNELELNYIQKLNVQLEMLLAMTLMGNFNDEKLEWSNNLEMLQIQLNNIERLKTLSDEDFAILYGTYCFIACRFHLAKSEYNRMKTITEDGLKKLISYNSEQAIDLQSKLCTNCAIAIKHIENIEKCVEYLECNDTISRNPKVAKTNTYIISYHTHNASLYTGNNPKAALGEFQKIKDICKEYTQEAYLHNLHNIASMEFVIGNYEEAEAEAKTVNKSAYEYNIQIEQGRSENLLASLCWVNGDLEKAKERYYKSYKFLKGISHNTHIWPPLVNLSALCLKSDDLINAEKYSNEATEFLIKNHCSQLKNAVVSKNKMPKIIVAILVLLDNYYHIDCEHSQIQYILSEVNSNDLENVFDEYIKKDLLLEYLDGTSYVCSGKLILKV